MSKAGIGFDLPVFSRISVVCLEMVGCPYLLPWKLVDDCALLGSAVLYPACAPRLKRRTEVTMALITLGRTAQRVGALVGNFFGSLGQYLTSPM